MQKLPVYLYANLFDVTLDLDNNKEINQIMYQRPIKIQKGVKNTVQLQFKNSDQKLLDISSATFFMNVYEISENRSLVLSKPVNILDTGSTATVYSTKGLGEIQITSTDTLDLEAKSYHFSIVKRDVDGSFSPAYSNTYYEVPGILELKDEIFAAPKPTVEVTNFARVYNSNPGSLLWEYNTGNLRVYPDSLNKTGLHTAAFYMTNFRGTVFLEGSLENSPGTFGRYAILQGKTYDRFTGIDYVNVNGLFTHLRVRYIPAINPGSGRNDDIAYTGSFDKVLIRS